MTPRKEISQTCDNSIGLYHIEASQSAVDLKKATKGNLAASNDYPTPTFSLRPTYGLHGILTWPFSWSYTNLISGQLPLRYQSTDCHRADELFGFGLVEGQPAEGCRCLYLHDCWKPRYCIQLDFIGLRENLTYLEMIKEHDPDVPEIATFILPDPRSQRWKRISSYIESFCEGASFVFDNSIPGDSNNPDFRDLQEPRAWVSDWDRSAEVLSLPERAYGRVLNYLELYAVLQAKAFLHQAACAFIITGKSERYWTAVFLDEDFEVDVPKLSVEEEEDVAVGGIDPITVDAEFESADTIVSPRAYALASLAAAIGGIAEHHAYIQEEFAASLSRHILDPQETRDKLPCQKLQEWRSSFQDSIGRVRYGTIQLLRKVNEFLDQDVCISPDGLPCSPPWVSVQEEPAAIKSLRKVIASRNRLREISHELDYLVDEAKREVRNNSQAFA
ncbi:hypothetical protein F53441_7685 [Fusarium austroafricanum]|uniref:Uncharacterized protein n=1 Tax=Fusarium austroafricanum TaxID=2364996 RepID=A0A8H4KD14_9HYPO|nr:hypothetical protein F53441_7685 [Fusarium austroafricanum]